MKRWVLVMAIIIITSACTPAYAENTITDSIKEILDPETVEDIKRGKEKIISEVGSLVSEAKDEALEIKSVFEEEVLKEAQQLAGEGYGQLKDKLKEGLPKVIEELKAALEETPTDTKLLLKLAIAYKLGGEYSLAITVAEKVLTFDPESEEAALIVAQCYRLKGEAREGIQFLQDYTKQKANDPKVKIYLAAMLLEVGNAKKAIEVMEEAVSKSPTEADYYKKLGECYEKAGVKGVKLFVNGKKVDFKKYGSVEPFVKNGTTLVPVRALADSLDADIKYDPRASTVRVRTGNKDILLKLNQKTAKVGTKEVKLNVPVQLINGRTMLPIRFISEHMDKKVGWYAYSKYGIVSINEK